MSNVIIPYEIRNNTVSRGIRLFFFLGATIGITDVSADKGFKLPPQSQVTRTGELQLGRQQ
jgi:hypothetical protein